MKGLPSYPNPHLRHRAFAEGVQRPRLFYRFCRCVLQALFAALWRVVVFNRHQEPTAGSVLYICNHQSFLDPVLMSLALRRPVHYMARESLFGNRAFRRLIEALNAFPVKRATADTGALKEAMRRLKAGGQLVVFAEGTRTRDGSIGPFLPGVSLLAQRAADWIVPTVIDGAYEAWPRTAALPMPGQIRVAYGAPLTNAQARALGGEAMLAEVRRRVIELQAALRARRAID